MRPPLPSPAAPAAQFSAIDLLAGHATAAAEWQLCLAAEPSAHSLTLLFRRLRLPAGASLRICPGAPFGTTSCTQLGAGAAGWMATVPGSVALLSLTGGTAAAALELGAVLQGVQPLPWQLGAAGAAAARKAGPAANRTAALEAALEGVEGTSNSACPYLDVACGGREWQAPASAVVLLLLASPAGGPGAGRAGGCWVLGASAPLPPQCSAALPACLLAPLCRSQVLHRQVQAMGWGGGRAHPPCTHARRPAAALTPPSPLARRCSDLHR